MATEQQRAYWLATIHAQDSRHAATWSDAELAAAFIVAVNPGITLDEFCSIAYGAPDAQPQQPTETEQADANARFLSALNTGALKLPVTVSPQQATPPTGG